MNEELNLIEILKNCPKRAKLYSSVCGEVEFVRTDNDPNYPIDCWSEKAGNVSFSKEGQYFKGGECTIFPSKDVRTWDGFNQKKPKFNPKTLKAFDRVLVKDHSTTKWKIDFFSHIDNGKLICLIASWKLVIPYNDKTKHLVGTTKEAPEFYRYWED